MEGLQVRHSNTGKDQEGKDTRGGGITTRLRYGVELMLRGHLDATFCL